MQANGPRNTEEESVVRRAQHGGEEQASTGAVPCPLCVPSMVPMSTRHSNYKAQSARHSRVEEKRRSL